MASPEWIDRTIRGPESEYLTTDELRKLFPNVPDDWIDNRIKDGTIPAPIKLSARSIFFTWEHAVFVALLLKLKGGNPGEKASGKQEG